MSAVLQPIDPVIRRVDFQVQIDERIKARVEALASRISVDMNELVEHLVKRWVERTAPEEPDVTIHRVSAGRGEGTSMKSASRGHAGAYEEGGVWMALDFDPFSADQSDRTVLTITTHKKLKAWIEQLAYRIDWSVDELVTHLVGRELVSMTIEVTGEEYADAKPAGLRRKGVIHVA